MLSVKSVRFLSVLILFVLLAAGCGGTASGTYVWIDVPVDGLFYPDIQPVNVEGHATSREGIARVELFVDGELWTTFDDPPVEGDLASFQAEWLPPGPGSYTIHAVAYGPDGAPSEYDETRITLGMDTPTPVPLEDELVILITPETPTPPLEPGASIKFWADPDTIAAGDCTNIYWQAENVKSVVFGGREQAFEGTYQACLCKNETYTLSVTHLDGKEEKLKVNISVTGTCEDTTPPPAPKQEVPGDGLSIDCKSYQDLVWQPVSDESGISEYQVQAQRHSGNNNWSDVSGSVFGGISGKKLNMSVECGWYYRWRVRAKDGEDNVGSWSGWRDFVINLN